MRQSPRTDPTTVNRRLIFLKSTASLDAAAVENQPMSVFPIRLVARTTEEGSADFKVEAASATEAATIVAEAHRRAQAAGIGLVVLPDGQEGLVEGERVIARGRNFYLIDDAGLEVEEIPVVEPPSRPHER